MDDPQVSNELQQMMTADQEAALANDLIQAMYDHVQLASNPRSRQYQPSSPLESKRGLYERVFDGALKLVHDSEFVLTPSPTDAIKNPNIDAGGIRFALTGPTDREYVAVFSVSKKHGWDSYAACVKRTEPAMTPDLDAALHEGKSSPYTGPGGSYPAWLDGDGNPRPPLD